MDFVSRIKKEMTEGVVKAILEDANYRTIGYGIEKTVREVSHMAESDYRALLFPDSMRKAPDLVVMNERQEEKFLVEIKYRSTWNKQLLLSMEEQVKLFREIVLVSINARPNNKFDVYYPSTYLRCCRMKYEDGAVKIHSREKINYPLGDARSHSEISHKWKNLEYLSDTDALWWSMSPLEEVFCQIKGLDKNETLDAAIHAIQGILVMPGQE